MRYIFPHNGYDTFSMTNNRVASSIDNEFLAKIDESYAMYKEHGSRSTKKLLPIHGFIENKLRELIIAKYGTISGYELKSIYSGKESNVKGLLYNKNVDVCITKDKKPVYVVSLKSIQSNFKQNNNNYFESMLGEAVNLISSNIVFRQADSVEAQDIVENYMGFAYLTVLPNEVFYYKKNKDVKNIEKIMMANVDKYLKLCKFSILAKENNQKIFPFPVLLYLVKNSEGKHEMAYPTDIDTLPENKRDEYTKDFDKLFSLENFLKKIIESI